MLKLDPCMLVANLINSPLHNQNNNVKCWIATLFLLFKLLYFVSSPFYGLYGLLTILGIVFCVGLLCPTV